MDVSHGTAGHVHVQVFVRSGRTDVQHGNVLKGSWDLVTEVISKVAIVIITYNPN